MNRLVVLTVAAVWTGVVAIYAVQGATIPVANQVLSALLIFIAFGLHLDILLPSSPSREPLSPEEQQRAAQGSDKRTGLQQRRGTQPRGAAPRAEKVFGEPR